MNGRQRKVFVTRFSRKILRKRDVDVNITKKDVKKTNLPWENGLLKVSQNGRFLAHQNGTPFFWLGDTGWLLFSRLTREEAEIYLEDRTQKGFNVIQVMALHKLNDKNAYGYPAFEDFRTTDWEKVLGAGYNSESYGYWDHMEYIIDLAADKGLYMAIVPIWGTMVKNLDLNGDEVYRYAKWLALRYKDKPNIIWLNGGDVRGDDHPGVWKTIGYTIKENDPDHLMTFHPFGRTQSSTWFHNEPWLDFNMFQSGHRRYDQRTLNKSDDTTIEDGEWKGEDNWKYVEEDYAKEKAKPTIDGEPSYEDIPQGLHNPAEPYWNADDCRRYAYWAVFAGAFGHTYGHNSVMQMHRPGGKGSYGVRKYWQEALNDTGAQQMRHLKSLMLSVSFFDRIPDQTLIAGENGQSYDRLIATRAQNYAFIYTYKGQKITVNMGKVLGNTINVWWFNPRNGEYIFVDVFLNSDTHEFYPPEHENKANDWVLVIKSNNHII